MAAAYSNSLQALNGIYGVLDIIVQKMSTTNTPQAQQEKAQNDVKTLNKGGLDGVKETPAKEKSGEITGIKASITVSEISAALLSLPPAIKAVSKLGGATTNKAVRVITGLADAFSFLAENKDSKNGAIALKNIADALNIFQELKIVPLAFKLTILDKLNVGKKMGAVLGDIVEGYKRGSGLSKKEAEAFSIVVSCTTNMTEFVENFAKLRKKMPRFKASVDAFVPVFEKLVKTIEKTPEESKVKAAAAATKMVAEFAKGSGIVIAEVVAIAVAIKAVGAQAIWIGLGVVAATLTLLTGLTLLVNLLAGKSRNSIKSMENISKFIMSLSITTGLIMVLSIFAATYSPLIFAGIGIVAGILIGVTALAVGIGLVVRFMHARRSIRQVRKFIFDMVVLTGAVMLMSVYAATHKATIMQGLGLVAGIIIGLTAIVLLTSLLSSLMPNKLGMLAVLGVAAFALSLILSTLLIGALVSIPGVIPLILIGFATVTAILLAYTAVVVLASLIADIVEINSKKLFAVLGIVAFSVALVLATMVIGALAIEGWPLLLAGLGSVAGVLLAYEGILWIVSKLAVKMEILEKSGAVKNVLMFIGGMLLITAATVAIGYFVKKVGPEGIIGAIGVLAIVIMGSLKVARHISAHSEEYLKANVDMKNLLIFLGGCELLAGGILALAAGYKGLGDTWAERTAYVVAGFGMVIGMVQMALKVAKEISRNSITFTKSTADILPLLAFMGGAELLAGGVLGIAAGLKALVGGDSWKDGVSGTLFVAAAFGLVHLIIKEAESISREAAKYSTVIKAGATSLLLAEAVIGAAELLVGGIIGLATGIRNFFGESDLTTIEGLKAAGGNALCLAGAFGLTFLILKWAEQISRDASRKKTIIIAGATSLLLAEAVIGAAEIVAFGIIALAKSMNGVELKDIAIVMAMLVAIVQGAAKLAKVASKQQANIIKGALAILVCEGLLLAGGLVLGVLINVAKKGDGQWDNLGNAMIAMTALIGLVGGMAIAAGALLFGPQAALFGLGAAALAACEALAYAGSKMLNAFIEVAIKYNADPEMSKKIGAAFGGMKAIIKMERDFAIESSKGVIKALAGAVALKKMTKLLDQICDTITKLITVSTFMEKSGTTSDALKTQIGDVLSAISPDIFVEFFDGKKGSMVGKLVKVHAGYKSYKKVLDLVESAFDMYGKFVTATKGTKINPEELTSVAETIASSLGTFMENLNIKTLDIKEKHAKRAAGVLNALIEPLSQFAEMLTKFSANEGKLAIITYDSNGNAKVGAYVNVGAVAEIIAGTVSDFCGYLFGKENIDMWKSLAKGGKGDENSPLQRGVGVFAAVIDPVAKFAEVLMRFQDGDGNTLEIPEYDENGKLKGTRKVNVITVASILANAVTTFIDELYVKNKVKWQTVLDSLNEIDPALVEGEEKTGNKAGLSDAIGIFGEILNPILNFASVLLKFGTKGDQLTVLDEEGKAHPVDILAISTGIATAVTTFIEKIAGIFNDTTMESISKMNENSVNVLNVLNGFVENISNAAQIDLGKLGIATAAIPLFVRKFTESITSLNASVNEEKLKIFEDSFTKLNTALTTFIVDTYSAESLEQFANSTLQLQDNANTLIHGILIPEDIAAFETTVTDFITFLGSAYTDLFSSISKEDARYTDFLNTNTEMANSIKESLNTLFSTLSVGEQLETFVNQSTEYKAQISETIDNFLKDFIKQESLDTFTNSIDSFREILDKEFNKVFGAVAFSTISTKIIIFTKGVRAAITGMFKTLVNPEHLNAFTSSMDLVSGSIQNVLGETIPDDSLMRFDRIMNTIKSSTEILANEKTITDTDKFNKNLETLMNNLNSASETSKTKRISAFGTAVKTTTGEMTKFDSTLKNGNAARIKDLNELGKAVGNVSTKIKNAKEGLSELKGVLNSIERADRNKIADLAEAIKTGSDRAQSGGNGGGGGVSINYKQLAEELAKAIAKVFDNASITSSTSRKVTVENGGTTKEQIVPQYTLDIDDSLYND